MTDVVDKKTRSRMMSGIQGKNTKPELTIRKNLHALGFRYKIHDTTLPGKPDIVLPKYKAVIFVNGCFWHGHDCHLFKWPKSREEFWHGKINRTREKDKENIETLLDNGWRVLQIWECAIKGKTRLPLESVIEMTEHWIRSSNPRLEINGQDNGENQ